VNARDILHTNGTFTNSPLADTVRRLHAICEKAEVEYALVGGLALTHNGAPRTTMDVDVLVEESGWDALRAEAAGQFTFEQDSATDRANGVPVDFLFPGDDWHMCIPLPQPAAIREYDDDLGAWFAGLQPLIEIKTAVYLKKRAEDGMEIAAKDLGDVVELTLRNAPRIDDAFVRALAPAVRRHYRRIRRRVLRSRAATRGGRRSPPGSPDRRD
jgi:hypothetical protein